MMSHLDWTTDPLKKSERMQLSLMIRENKTINEYMEELNRIASQCNQRDDWTMLALVLNDSPEKYRLLAFNQLREKSSERYAQIINIISDIHIRRETVDPQSLFPCIATKTYIDTLQSLARQCLKCKKAFQEGHNLIWKPCGQHAFCQSCWSILHKKMDVPFHYWCHCIPNKYITEDPDALVLRRRKVDGEVVALNPFTDSLDGTTSCL